MWHLAHLPLCSERSEMEYGIVGGSMVEATSKAGSQRWDVCDHRSGQDTVWPGLPLFSHLKLTENDLKLKNTYFHFLMQCAADSTEL